MTQNESVRVSGGIKVVVGNPSALGLLGLAVVTLVASSQKLGWTTGTAAIVPWAIFLGAAAQFVAGLLDYKHDNSFGATAFCGYGMFWFAVAMSWMTQLGVFGAKAAETFSGAQLGVAFVAFFVFSVVMTLGSLGTNKVLFVIFVLIDLLFLGLSTQLLLGSHVGHKLAAWSELLIALTSFYAMSANVLNTHYGRVIVPVGKPFGPWVKRPMPAPAPAPVVSAAVLDPAE